MSLEGFRLLCAVAGKLTVGFDTAVFYLLWNTFYRQARERAVLIAGGALLILNLGLDFIPDIPRSGLYLASAVIILVYALKRFGRHIEMTVLSMTVFYGFRSMDFMISNSIYQSLNSALFADPGKINIDTIYTRSAIAYAAFNLIYILIFAVMLLALYKVIKPVESMGWHDVVFLSVPNIAGGLFMNFALKISIVPLGTDVFYLYDSKKSTPLLLSLISLLIFSGEMTAIIIFQRYRQLQAEKEIHISEREQVKAMKQRLTEAEAFYGSIRKVRHDMKSHAMTMKGLAATEKYAELEQYIGKLNETIEELDYQISTGNAVTDVIINDRAKRAKKENIRFDAEFVFDDDIEIPVFDIGIVLANLLDNAVEACARKKEGERFVRTKLSRSGNFLLLTVENSFDGVLSPAEDDLPATSKRVMLPELLSEHGVGLGNVREIAKRYVGTMEITAEDNIFKVMVMLQQPLRRSAEKRND